MAHRPTFRPPRRRDSTPRAFWWGVLVLALVGVVAVARQVTEPPQPGAQGRVEGQPGASLLSPEPVPTPEVEPAASPTSEPTGAAAPTLPPMPTPITVPRSSPFSPTPLTPDPELARRVVSILEGRPGRFGVAIKELDTGRGVLIDPDSEYPAASLYKLPVMYEVFKQRDLEAISFDEVLVFTEHHVAYDLGTLDRPAGSPIVLREALERMIMISDNSSAVLLTDRVGALNINRDMAGLGLGHTRVLLEDLVTSPADMLSLLEMIARGQAVSPRASLEMLHLMGRQQIRDRLPRLLPPGTMVANKTANLAGVVSDVGIISSTATSFAIAVLVANTPSEGSAALAIAEIAAAALDHFQAARREATPTSIPTETPTPSPQLVPRATTALTPVSTFAPGPGGAATVGPAPGPSPTRTATPRP